MDFLEEEFDEILRIFQIESDEIISRLNNTLLDLEKKPSNKDAILMLFRDAHSLKGAARMIGFNNVQTIAHKVEDILGLAKDGQLELNTKIVDVIYKTVDFLAALIQQSITHKKEVYNDSIRKQISMLENVRSLTDDSPSKKNVVDFNVDLLIQNIGLINNTLAESIAVLMDIEAKKDESLIETLFEKIDKLHSLFMDIDIFDIKKGFEDISVKLKFVLKATHELNHSESEEIQQILNNIITSLIAVCEIYNLDSIDYYDEAFKINSGSLQLEAKKEPTINDTPSQKEEVAHWVEEVWDAKEKPPTALPIKGSTAEDLSEDLEPHPAENLIENVVYDLKDIKDRFAEISLNNSSFDEIKEFLKSFKQSCDNEVVKQVMQLIITILEYAEFNQIELEEDTVSALQQGIEYCDDVIENKSEAADKELVIQRLDIIQQLLEFSNQKNEDFMPAPQKNAVAKGEKFSDFSKIFDSGEIKTLRVDSSKLDTLVNQVGELIVTKIKSKKHLHEMTLINKDLEEWQRSSIKSLNYLKHYDKKYFSEGELSESPAAFFVKQLLGLFADNNKKFADAIKSVSNLQRVVQDDDMKMNLIVDDLEHLVKNIRVLPLATIFHLFGRMVRDIAQEKNKKIELEIIGSETSTDKKIIEEIKTPLIHIIRNAIDHGIETPEERIALGKNPVGKIVLRARQVDNSVIIEIQDDGKGINVEKIREKALHKGYLSEEDAKSMTDEQITNIIFAPGFSTGDEITSISGRGIGLDIVQTKISQMNGKVKIVSEINKGCCVQIELPTSMSTLKSFLVESAHQKFAIPMSAINTVVWKKSSEIISNNQNRSILFNGKTIPVHRLSDILNLTDNEDTENIKETVLVIEGDNKIIGLAVDKLMGDQEILHKKLSAPLYRLKNISGVTTLASGEICMILNISDVLKTISNPIMIKAQNQTQLAVNKKNNEEYKILLVDDSITTRTLEKNILTKAGYNIEIATNPTEAFSKMKSMRFDLIISDIEMPGMDGFEFLGELKTNEMYFDIPVIIVSSMVSEENQKRAKSMGAAGYISKREFDQNDFLEKINALLIS